MPQRNTALNTAQTALAHKLFELYPTFLPTRSLYLDLEGSGRGIESIASFYWPRNSGSSRFTWAVRSPMKPLDTSDVQAAIQSLGLSGVEPRWVVVYSQGRYCAHERDRVVDLLGADPWPKAEWVNLLHAFQECREMTDLIREHRHVKYFSDKTQIRRSLESLEWEFGIIRPPSIRSHNNRYSDGQIGGMRVLDLAAKYIAGSANKTQANTLAYYCRQDVASMQLIARACELGIWTKQQRAVRYNRFG